MPQRLELETRARSDFEIDTPLSEDMGYCRVVHGFLSESECRELINKSEAMGFRNAAADYPPSYRDNDRLVMDDAALAERLFARLQSILDGCGVLRSVAVADGARLTGINERIRICRYRAGTHFGLHQDGVHHRGPGTRSRLTFMVYLNDDGFTGGETLFFRTGPGQSQGEPIRVRPRTGSLIVFDHAVWHAGARVDTGLKYVLRSDLIYDGAVELSAPGPFLPGHNGYIWTLLEMADGVIASAGRDTTIRLWAPGGEPICQLEGHRQSVLALAQVGAGRLVSVSRDRTLRLWHVGKQKNRVIGTTDCAMLTVAALPGDRVATGDANGNLTIWDLRAGASSSRIAHAGWVWSVKALGNGELVTASEDGTVNVWDSRADRPSWMLECGEPLRTVDSWNLGTQLLCIATGDTRGRIHVAERRGTTWRRHAFPAHAAAVRRVRFCSASELLTCGEDGRVYRWTLPTGQRELICEHDNFATDALPLRDGGILSAGYDGRIRRS